MIVYHGSGLAIGTPDLVHSRKAVDFGAGFYTTPILKQAVNWCEKRRHRWGVMWFLAMRLTRMRRRI